MPRHIGCYGLGLLAWMGVFASPTEAQAPPSAAADIARWAKQPSSGPEGRPLPLAGTWNTDAWSPSYLVELIRQGHHVPVAFVDPSSKAFYAQIPGAKKDQAAQLIRDYYKPALEYARDHQLPIVFRGWNWGQAPVGHQEKKMRLEKSQIPTAQLANVLIGGQPQKETDPFGPIEAWKEWGAFWFGNALLKEIQSIYPDPPAILFLNNNEAGELHSAAGVEKFDRFIAKFGSEPRSRDFLAKAVRDGYAERYAAMFAAAKEALVAPAWKTNVRFVAYNSLWGTGYIGNGGPKNGLDFDGERGWTQWRLYDGSMPELYDNDWQPGKSDATPNGMQAEAGNYYSMQARLFAERPDFYWTAIFWDGAITSEVFRGRRATSKPFRYASSGQRWSFERYEGWVQFCLWATRPRLAFEFRGGEPLEAMRQGTWLALLNSVDRSWTNAVLKEFWQQGELVANTNEAPWANDIPDEAPAWVKALNRWYILTCDANPPRDTWGPGTRLSVFAEALVLGKAPARRWLVYAHAPLGGVSPATVTIPGYGAITLPSVPRSGSFFLVKESGQSVQTLLAGGPDEITIAAVADPKAAWPASKWVKPGQPVVFTAKAAFAPGGAWSRFVWTFGDGETLEQKTLAGVTHAFAKPGAYWVTVEGRDAKSGTVRDQVAVFVGEAPAEAVVYDLALDDAMTWEGPWEGIGSNGLTLATYRHTPNRGTGPSAVVTGGRFVDDAERGRVLELADDQGGIWLKRDKQTVMTGQEGASNRTVSFWFKAENATRRQVLYASGMESVGANIYLDQGQLYAGSWATVDGVHTGQDPLYGYNWKGDWIKSGPIETGRWYRVAWVLKNGTGKVEPDKQTLFLNGKKAGTAPGARIPVEYVVPRVGRTNMGGDSGPGIGQRAMTRFHDQAARDAWTAKERMQANALPAFRGRFDDFRFTNEAEGEKP